MSGTIDSTAIVVLLLSLNVILTLGLIGAWVMFIVWKGVLKEVMEQLTSAIEVNKQIGQRTFKELT